MKQKHVWYECPRDDTCLTASGRGSCIYCDGGLASCTVCRCAEGTLPSECPGQPVPGDKQDEIYAGRLDYRDGAWVTKPSGSACWHYDGRPGLPEKQQLE